MSKRVFLATCSMFVFQTQGLILMDLRLLITRAHNAHPKSKRKHDTGSDEKKCMKLCQRSTPSPLASIYHIASAQKEEFKGCLYGWIKRIPKKRRLRAATCMRL